MDALINFPELPMLIESKIIYVVKIFGAEIGCQKKIEFPNSPIKIE